MTKEVSLDEAARRRIPDNFVTEKRLGKFTIKTDLIRDKPEIVQMLMAQVIVIGCQDDFRSQGIEYTAYSKLFDPLENDGQKTPIYEFEVEVIEQYKLKVSEKIEQGMMELPRKIRIRKDGEFEVEEQEPVPMFIGEDIPF